MRPVFSFSGPYLLSARVRSNFVDEARILVRGGPGGNGCLSFRREKFVPRGGPDGGNGGSGGSVILVADPDVHSLLEFRYRAEYRGERGRHGEGSDKAGKSGSDRVLRVPVGTLVLDEAGERALADLSEPGQEFIAAEGGHGGRGNACFASSTNRAPTRHEPGGPGESRELRLELKLLADVGLVGLPNAGKSTLISRVSAARPKIADYPFTTLVPNLGVVNRGSFDTFVMADVPGLIEGAHRGSGLGHRFLRHVERCRVLLHLVDPTVPDRDPVADIRVIQRELRRYRKELGQKPRILVMTKVDSLQDEEVTRRVEEYAEKSGLPLLKVSAVTGEGLDELVHMTGQTLDRLEEERKRVRVLKPPTPTEPLRFKAILGGTYDPVHLGHLAICRRVRDLFGLSSVVLMPAYTPPHKLDVNITPVEDRLEMLRLAIEDEEGFEISTAEIERGGVSFTLDTLRALREDAAFDAHPLFIVGMDSLVDFPTWHRWETLLREFDFIAVDRPDEEDRPLSPEILPRLVRVPEGRRAGLDLLSDRDTAGGSVYRVALEPIPISSSEIRRRAAAGEDLDGLVPPGVARYIRERKLYREETSR